MEEKKINHREAVGGLWDQMGNLQYNFLLSKGLKKEHKFLDIGCGSLRLGVKLIPYLNAGNYYGIEKDESLLKLGIKNEIDIKVLSTKNPSFLINNKFELEKFNAKFDFIIAQSIFTHITMDEIQICLMNVKKVLKQGGIFFATFFEADTNEKLINQQGKKVFYQKRDFFKYLANTVNLKFEYLGDWNHPRGQKIMSFKNI